MARFLVSRLIALVLVLLFLTATMFVLREAAPGDPAKQILGANATEQALEEKRRELWLDRPLPVQYVKYVADAARGDLGISTRTQRPVREDLVRYLPPSILLGVLAISLAVVLGLGLGALTGVGARGASIGNNLLIALASIPSFLLGVVAVIVFYATLRWLPSGGQTGVFGVADGPTNATFVDAVLRGNVSLAVDAAKHLILPVTVLAVGPAVAIARVFRSSVSSTMRADHIRTARSKGLTEGRIVRRHAMRNSSGPALAMVGLQFGGMFASLAVVEVIFAWPGIGSYVAQSIPAGDFPGIAGVTLVAGVAYVVTNAVIDVLQVVADPRLRL
jgi:peptide/nickel transport system permease protein